MTLGLLHRNGLKDESLHMETKSHSEETNVIAHEVRNFTLLSNSCFMKNGLQALVRMSKEDTLDVFVDQTKDALYGILFCIALV